MYMETLRVPQNSTGIVHRYSGGTARYTVRSKRGQSVECIHYQVSSGVACEKGEIVERVGILPITLGPLSLLRKRGIESGEGGRCRCGRGVVCYHVLAGGRVESADGRIRICGPATLRTWRLIAPMP